jgi:hypothetical protein
VICGRIDSLSHANPQNGNFASEMLDSISANPRISFRMAGTRTDHQLGRVELGKLFHSDHIISVDRDRRTFEDKVLVNVPRKGIEIVDQDDIGSIRKGRDRLWLLGRIIDEIEGRHLARRCVD